MSRGRDDALSDPPISRLAADRRRLREARQTRSSATNGASPSPALRQEENRGQETIAAASSSPAKRGPCRARARGASRIAGRESRQRAAWLGPQQHFYFADIVGISNRLERQNKAAQRIVKIESWPKMYTPCEALSVRPRHGADSERQLSKRSTVGPVGSRS